MTIKRTIGRGVRLNIPVDIDHAGSLLEDITDLPRDLDLAALRGSVNFCNEGFEHGRAGRNLGDFDARAETRGYGNQLLANALGDVVALETALRLPNKVHLDIGDIGAAPQEVMPHQAIKIVRRCDTSVSLEIHDIGLSLNDCGKLSRHARRV